MFFRRMPLHSIDTAREMMHHAMHIAYGYKRNKKYMPTEEEVKKFELFEAELWRHYCTARYILHSMNRRICGKAEEPAEWLKLGVEETDE